MILGAANVDDGAAGNPLESVQINFGILRISGQPQRGTGIG